MAAVASGAAAPSAQRGGVVPQRVTVGGLRLGGLPAEQARAALNWAYNRPLRFVFYGKRWRVRPATLGASVDVRKTLSRAPKAQPEQKAALTAHMHCARAGRFAHCHAAPASL